MRILFPIPVCSSLLGAASTITLDISLPIHTPSANVMTIEVNTSFSKFCYSPNILCYSYSDYHNKSTVICVYVKLPTKQKHMLYSLLASSPGLRIGTVQTCLSSSDFITSHFFYLLLSLGSKQHLGCYSRPWPPFSTPCSLPLTPPPYKYGRRCLRGHSASWSPFSSYVGSIRNS